MKKYISGLAFASLLIAAGSATAATYDFNTSGPSVTQLTNVAPTSGAGPSIPTITVTPGANGILNFAGALVTQNSNGLGVNGRPDTNPGNIDGFPVLSAEFLTVTFGWAVNLVGFKLGAVDGNDHYDISINGGAFVNSLTALLDNAVNINNVTSFTIRASGTPWVDGFGNDDFTLSQIEVAPVPVPAAFGLLAMALGGLGFARRGRKAA